MRRLSALAPVEIIVGVMLPAETFSQVVVHPGGGVRRSFSMASVETAADPM